MVKMLFHAENSTSTGLVIFRDIGINVPAHGTTAYANRTIKSSLTDKIIYAL